MKCCSSAGTVMLLRATKESVTAEASLETLVCCTGWLCLGLDVSSVGLLSLWVMVISIVVRCQHTECLRRFVQGKYTICLCFKLITLSTHHSLTCNSVYM